MAVQIQLRNDTAADWTAANPTLMVGEFGLETDTRRFKIGDGVTAWNSLGYGALDVPSLVSVNLSGQSSEAVKIVAAGLTTSPYNFDVTDNAVQYLTQDASGSGTINFRGSSSVTLNTFMTTGTAITSALYVTNGATAYYPNDFEIDGVQVIPLWNGGSAPTGGNANSVDLYVFNIVKTGNAAFTVFATQVQYA